MPPRGRKQQPLAGDGGDANAPLPASVTKFTGLRDDEARGATKEPGFLPLRPDSVDPMDAAAGEEEEEEPREKGEKAAGASQSEGKGKIPAAFERVWSGTDEVLILESLAAYVELNRSYRPRSQLCNVVAEHHPDKKKFDLTKLYEKIRHLKTRYEKLCGDGAPPPPGLNGEQLRKWELSDKIWGKLLHANKKGAPALDEAPDTHARSRRGFEELRGMHPHLAVTVDRISTGKNAHLKRAFELIDDARASELDAKLKKQRVLEVKTEMKGVTLRGEVLKTLVSYMD